MHKVRPFKAWLALIGYVLLPAIIIGRMLTAYPELPANRLLGMLLSAVSIGILLVLVSLAASHYPKGSYPRLGFNMAFVAGTIVWFLGILGWSPIVNMSYDTYAFQLRLSKYLGLLILVGVLNTAYYLAETSVFHHSVSHTFGHMSEEMEEESTVAAEDVHTA